MSSVNQQYLKDKDGNNFSPITSTESIYKGNTPLNDIVNNIGDNCIKEPVWDSDYTFTKSCGSSGDFDTTIREYKAIKPFVGLAFFYVQWEYNSNTNSLRGIKLSSKSNGTGKEIDLVGDIRLAAIDGSTTRQSVCYPMNMEQNEVLYFKLFQNSGNVIKYAYRCRILAFKNI